MAKVKQYGEVVRDFGPLRVGRNARLDCRVLDTSQGRRLDVREFVDDEMFQGYTRKGIRLTADEFGALLKHGEGIAALLGPPADASPVNGILQPRHEVSR